MEVRVGDALISDIGTTFDVYLTDDKVTVTVIDGTLELSKPGAGIASTSAQHSAGTMLHQGERGELRRNSAALHVERLDMSRILADISWTRGELIFDSAPLQEVVRQFNRYNRRPQIEIRDPSIDSLKMSGVFHTRDPQSFIESLQMIEPRVRVRSAELSDGDILLGTAR